MVYCAGKIVQRSNIKTLNYISRIGNILPIVGQNGMHREISKVYECYFFEYIFILFNFFGYKNDIDMPIYNTF